jgi:hypothetical protein
VSIDIESADGLAWPGLVVSLAQGNGQDNGLGQGLEPPP